MYKQTFSVYFTLLVGIQQRNKIQKYITKIMQRNFKLKSGLCIFNSTFNNISVILWWLLEEENQYEEKPIDLQQVTDKA